jgi:cytoskeletal protein RodZ
MLAAAREQAGWTLVEAAEQLHLDVAIVRALEAGRFEVLGAAVYARGHLRRYAELLGLPVQEIEQAFLQQHPGRSAPDLRHGAGLLQKGDAGGGAIRPGVAAVGAALLVIVGIVLWAKRVPRRPVPAATVVADTAVQAPATSGASGASSGTASGTSSATSTSHERTGAMPAEGSLLGTPAPTHLPANVAAGPLDGLNGRPGALWDSTADSAARRSPVDGGGGVIETAPARTADGAPSRAPVRARDAGRFP